MAANEFFVSSGLGRLYERKGAGPKPTAAESAHFWPGFHPRRSSSSLPSPSYAIVCLFPT